MLYTKAKKICQYLGSSIETGVIDTYTYHTAICNAMHILNKENTR